MTCSTLPKSEESLVLPVRKLFPAKSHLHCQQVKLGRKRIDLVCLRRSKPHTTCIELKIKDWKTALWQAVVNLQVADESYIAVWHTFLHRARKHSELFEAYGVGLIVVEDECARFILNSRPKPRKVARRNKEAWYQQLLAQRAE